LQEKPGAVCKGTFDNPWLDELTEGLKENDCYTLGYADYITIIISRKFPNTISELLQGASGMVNSGVIGLDYLSVHKIW